MSKTIMGKAIIILLLVLTITSMTPQVYANTIYPYVIIPPPQLYSLISSNRILTSFGNLEDLIIKSANTTIANDTIFLNDGLIEISYPQPRPLISIDILKEHYNSLTVELEFSHEPSLWYLITNITGNNTIAYVRGINNATKHEYITDTLTLNGKLERVEIGFVPGVIFIYARTSNDNLVFYYPLPDETILKDITIKGKAAIKGKVYSVSLLSKGPEIIIPALEQEDLGGVTYHIIKSPDAYIVLLPYRVNVEFIRPPSMETISYKKRLVSAIDFPYATGILSAFIQPSINGTMISVNASFYHLIDLDKLIDELYYYVKYFIIEYDVKGVLVANNTTTTYNLGSYIMKLTDTRENLTIPVPEKFNEYIVNVSLYVPGILYGNLYNATRVNIGTIILNSSLIPEIHLAINNPYIRGSIKLSLAKIKKTSAINPCIEQSCKETIYNTSIVAEANITYMANVEAYLDKYYPYLRHYYLVTKVVADGNVYSYEKSVEDNKVSYEFQVPLSDNYLIVFSFKAPRIVVEENMLRDIVEENISVYNISLVTLEPKVIIDMPYINNVVVSRIPTVTRINIPVKVYWLPEEKTLLMTPTVYKVYSINPVTNDTELVYAFVSQWLSNTMLEVDVPIVSQYQDLLVEVKYLLGGRWVTVTKRILLNVSVQPTETTPTTTAINITNITTITITLNCTNITTTETIYKANTTITSTIYLANTTIVSLSTTTTTKTYVTTTTSISTTTTTVTTTSIKPVQVPITITSTYTPELPVLLVSPPYSYGVGALVAVVVAAISLRYLSRILGGRKR